MDLTGKVALITGGARVGKAVVQALAERGCHLVLVYHTSKKSAQETASSAQKEGVETLLIKADLTLNRDLADIIPKVKRHFGRLDILVNMASTYDYRSFSKLTFKDWDTEMNANLRHMYFLSVGAAKLMKQGGRIINFGDWTPHSGRPRYPELLHYYLAKAGVIALTEALALELAPKVLVNAISPGPILPASKLSKKEDVEVHKNTPLKRWGGAQEIAKTVLFLIETEFVTGESIRVDGGRHLY